MAADHAVKSILDYPMPDGRRLGDWTGADIDRCFERWDRAIRTAAEAAAAAHGRSVDELTKEVLTAWLVRHGYLKPPRFKA